MLSFRYATLEDLQQYFKWANDELVRKNSFNSSEISYHDHVTWFSSKVKHDNYCFYIFFDEQKNAVGQVRIEKKETHSIIGISIDAEHRGKSYGEFMLNAAVSDYLYNHAGLDIIAYIKTENAASIKTFTKAGFKYLDKTEVNGIESIRMIKKQV